VLLPLTWVSGTAVHNACEPLVNVMVPPSPGVTVAMRPGERPYFTTRVRTFQTKLIRNCNSFP
jgi:hypothetical protein